MVTFSTLETTQLQTNSISPRHMAYKYRSENLLSNNDIIFNDNHSIDPITYEYIHNNDISHVVYNDISITNPISSFSSKLQSKNNHTEIELHPDIPTAIHGSIEFQQSIRAKCSEYKYIISRSVSEEPVLVPLLHMKLEQML